MLTDQHTCLVFGQADQRLVFKRLQNRQKSLFFFMFGIQSPHKTDPSRPPEGFMYSFDRELGFLARGGGQNGTQNDDSDTVSELNHVLGGVRRSTLVQGGQHASLDVVKVWSEHRGL